MRGCRPHFCNEYEAIIGVDARSREIFLYEHDEKQHDSVEETAKRMEKEVRDKGNAALLESTPAWGRFSGRRDDALRALVRYVALHP